MSCVVALRGTLSRPAEERVLEKSGTTLLALEVTIRRPGAARADTVPASWIDGPKEVPSWLVPGAEVVVVGHVARRFFRAAGATQSRTEVVAHTVVPAKQAKRVDAALARAAAALLEVAGEG